MPHRKATRTCRDRYFPSVGSTTYAAEDSGSTIFQGGDDATLSPITTIKKHNRRNTEPIQSDSMRSSSTGTSTASWGSMFDFSAVLFSKKKSKRNVGHFGRASNSSAYAFPLDFNILSNSPSTTSCSGDDDYDSSSSSDSNDEVLLTTDEPVMGESIEIKANFINRTISPISSSQVGLVSPCLDANVTSPKRPVHYSHTNSIAEQWILMGSSEFPDPLSPIHSCNEYCCANSPKADLARDALSCDLFSSDHGSQHHQHYQIMNDDLSVVSETKSTARYTNNYRNFQCGTEIASMTRNVHIPISEQHRNTSTSTNEHQRNITRDACRYTTLESTSSREDFQCNKGQANSSLQQMAGRQGESSQQNGASNYNMSGDEGHANESSDEDEDNESLSDTEDVEEEEKLRKEAACWKTAIDPKSGRTYYYNTKTLETQWRKPLCCASPSERRAAIKKERQTLAFFANMEQNILRTIQQQHHHRSASGEPKRHHSMIETSPIKMKELAAQSSGPQHRRESEPPTSLQNPFKLIRTISSMEDSVLAALVQRVPSFRNTATKHNLVGSGTTFTTFSRQHDTADDQVTSGGIDNEKSHDVVQRHAVREDSLPFGALMEATRSQRNVGFDVHDGSSFNVSALMRMNSQHNSRFNMFEYIPEGENEDNSESCSNHNESSGMSPTRGNMSLSRQSGFINLKKSQCFGSSGKVNENEDQNEDDVEIDDPTNQFSYRDSLCRMSGSLALRVEMHNNSKEPITRENSLNLTEIVGGRQMKRDPSVALQDAEHWGSYLSESALRGLSIDEGEAMLELASITDRMGGIHSETDSSDDSADDTKSKVSTENVEPRLNSISFTGINSSGNLGWDATPELFADKPPRRESNVTARPSMIRPTSLRNTPTPAILESITTKSNAMEKPSMLRRNTCGTLYVGSTLSAPDKDATIKCVCAVYRAHILQSTLEDDDVDDKFKVFDDLSSAAGATKHDTLILPTLDDVSVFYRDVFSRAQMESDCIIISLIYVERLIKVTDGALRPRISNWRSILFSCMVMASKVWDDLSMWNADFSHTCPAGVEFQLSRINELEIAVLSALQYKVKVPAGEYAKYYFLLRSMLIKSGLGSEDLKAINPLDVEGAKQLQHISSQYQASVALMSDRQKVSMGRSKTTGGTHEIQNQFSIDGSIYSDSSNSSTPLTSPTCEKQQRSKVGLEHMVQL